MTVQPIPPQGPSRARRSHRLLRWSVLGVLSAIAIGAACRLWPDPEEIIFYSTYGYQKDGTAWQIPMRAKVQESRNLTSRVRELVHRGAERTADENSRLRKRLEDFIADDESGEHVELRFKDDPEGTIYRIADDTGGHPESDHDGVVQGSITLPDAVAQRLLAAQKSQHGWLTYQAASRDHTGEGRVRLIGPTGLSVVSDIDDTIKITEVPAGKAIVIVNTFYREFLPVAEMVERYRTFGEDVAFHYVSGGPWQLYRPVASFLIDGKHFPEGSFHMKYLAGDIRSPLDSIGSLQKFAATDATFDHKVEHITAIMKRFPHRKFILIGDSGERDPEVYRTVLEDETVGRQIQEIIIRDVLKNDPCRLRGMTIVPAPEVKKGKSQFDTN
jgi:hypothetical protein